MRFEFATAARIIFGVGALTEVGATAQSLGRKALVVRGVTEEQACPLYRMLREHGLAHASFAVAGEPAVALVRQGVQRAKDEACDLVIGFGGGSALDTAKAIAAMLTNSGDLLDYLEIIGRGKAISVPPLPCLAIPTTAGTGAEVTRNAVLASPEHRVKVSLRSPLMLPRLALVDPLLTHSMPPAVTASTGLDALTQLVEPFVSVRANPMTDGFCREGMQRVARSLRRAYEHGDDPAAREDMALASLFGGLALANAGLGVAHGFAAVIGGMFPAPHGAVCAALLPHVMNVNCRALAERQPAGVGLARYREVAQLLTGSSAAAVADAIAWVKDLCAALHIPGLSRYGVGAQDTPILVEKALQASSSKGNPLPLTAEEMAEIVSAAL